MSGAQPSADSPKQQTSRLGWAAALRILIQTILPASGIHPVLDAYRHTAENLEVDDLAAYTRTVPAALTYLG